MWKKVRLAIKFLLVLVLLASLSVLLQIWSHKVVGEGIASRAVKFERILDNPEGKVLFAGDSTAYGTGTTEPKYSTAGRFGDRYPTWSVYNLSENGLELRELGEQMSVYEGVFDLVVMQIGANDVLSIYSLPHIKRDADFLISEAKKKSNNVIWLAGGNIGATKFFPWPVSSFFDYWSTRARVILKKVARENDIFFVDLYTERGDTSFYNSDHEIFARDGLHLNDYGYSLWYKDIQSVIEENGLIEELANGQ